MDSEIAALEEGITQAAQLCQRLREENRELRRELEGLQGERRSLDEKIDSARSRIESLLKQIPE